MFKYTIEGVGINTGRRRVRTFIAANEIELSKLLEKDGTQHLRVISKHAHGRQDEEPRQQKVDVNVQVVAQAIRSAGQSACMVRIKYRKPGDTWVTDRVIEPYDFEKSYQTLMVLAWQAEPQLDGEAWRHFRLDRIVEISATGKPFKPRKAITVHTGDVGRFSIDNPKHTSRAKSKQTPEQLYALALRESLADGDLNTAELDRLITLNQVIDKHRLAALHAQHYAQMLMDLTLDGTLDEVERARLENIRVFLEHLGWCP